MDALSAPSRIVELRPKATDRYAAPAVLATFATASDSERIIVTDSVQPASSLQGSDSQAPRSARLP